MEDTINYSADKSVEEPNDAVKDATPVELYDEMRSRQMDLSWKNDLDEGIRSNDYLKEFNSVDDMAKKYIEMMSKSESGDDAVPSEYVWNVPEGYEIDADVDKEFKGIAKELNLSQNQFEKIQDFAFGLIKDTLDAGIDSEDFERQVKECEDKLSSKWGLNYNENLKKANYAVSKMWNDIGGVEYAEKIGVANDPYFIDMMYEVGKRITEDTFHTGNESSNINTFEDQINDIISDMGGPYFDSTHPKHNATVSKVRSLYEKMHNSRIGV